MIFMEIELVDQFFQAHIHFHINIKGKAIRILKILCSSNFVQRLYKSKNVYVICLSTGHLWEPKID